MAITRSMTRKPNHDACSRKRSKTRDNSGSASWSDLSHDLLFLLILKLGIIDFVAFSGVCKAWRSVALSNRNMFMASRRPMSLSFSSGSNNKKCYLEDREGRIFKTVLPHSSHRTCVGLTCGYLILFRKKTRNFLLLNPITRHELNFPRYPFPVDTSPGRVRAILVFSPSLSGWVFMFSHRLSKIVSFSLSNQLRWNHLISSFPICDLHFFQGKIYALNTYTRLCEVKLSPNPTLAILEVKNPPKSNEMSELVSSCERLFVIDCSTKNVFLSLEIDFNEMKWVTPTKRIEESALFLSKPEHGSATKLVVWVDARTQYERLGYFNDIDKFKYKGKFFYADMWYFPHDCLTVNRLHE